MSEHEQDYILIANTPDVSFILNPEEVSDIQWWSEADIEKEMKVNPETFSVWFPTVYKKVLTHLQQAN